ncbi:uncharacterized protein [Panulirus ornatus]|uniref:uncharacterized protein isoform X3 n=1 Tax=Panulirus ornatus TaxID=150431 RepID=UPI003A87F563
MDHGRCSSLQDAYASKVLWKEEGVVQVGCSVVAVVARLWRRGSVLALVEAAATRGQKSSLLAQTSYKSLRQGSTISYIANVYKWSKVPTLLFLEKARMLDEGDEPEGTKGEPEEESTAAPVILDNHQEEQSQEEIAEEVTQREPVEGDLEGGEDPEEFDNTEEQEHLIEAENKEQDKQEIEGNQTKEHIQDYGGVAEQVVEEKITQVEQEMHENLQPQEDALEVDHDEDTEEIEQEGNLVIDSQEEVVESDDEEEDKEIDLERPPALEDQKEVDILNEPEDIPLEEQETEVESSKHEEEEAFTEPNEDLNESEVMRIDQQDGNAAIIEPEDDMTVNIPESDSALSQEDEILTVAGEDTELDREADSAVDKQEETSPSCQDGDRDAEGQGQELEQHVENHERPDLNSELTDDRKNIEIFHNGIIEGAENVEVSCAENNAFVDQGEIENNEQLETEETLPEEPMEVDVNPEAGNDDDEEGEINGIVDIEGEIEDEDELNDDEELNPEDIINGNLSESKSLPDCRLKRNYCCVHCGINTQNPREYLYHLRDEHGERMKVFECPRCIYASKNQQKLIRHARMVHKLKIKRQESSSPYKRQFKSPRANVSPLKSTRASVSPGKSIRGSPGKSPRSSESTPDGWDGMDDDEDSHIDHDESPMKADDKKLHYCEHCDFSCRSRKLLNRHETSYHLKRRFFRCVKCNYVTHLKGRYTKHMKYHQLPILKCDYCDFRTPYRWNLDRHLKNHTEDCGEYKCHLCNFTAQIKQSLTVHISNHHLTAEQIREREMRRTIGISDPADCTSDDQEMELLRLERDEHPDALLLPGFDSPESPSNHDSSQGNHNGNNSFRVSNIDMGGQDDSHVNAEDSRDEDGEPKRKKPKIKITLKKMKLKVSKTKDTFFQELNERHNFEEDFIHPDDVVHRHGNVYIKTFKCHFCPFKAAFKNEVARHEKKIHSIPIPKYEGHSKKAKKPVKSSKAAKHKTITSSDDVISQILQFPQTDFQNMSSKAKIVDSLEKLNNLEDKDSELQGEETSYETSAHDLDSRDTSREESVETQEGHSSDSKESSPSKESAKKKSLSFFEKLQEKMPTSNVQNLVCQFCGHESKCLSESVRHQKLHLSAKNIFASASLSTRCQFCRHRCKTTDDLMNHLKLCPEARKNQITDSGRRLVSGRLDENEDSQFNEEGENQINYNDANSKDVNCSDIKRKISSGSVNKNDEKHPMENRVFVWNNFKIQQEGESSADRSKDKNTNENKEKLNKKIGADTTKRASGKGLGDKSPVIFEGPLDYIESPTPQGHHYYSKRVYRCPQCSFWATTASRFHVHIVGHFNRKPYNCSECGYKSNWRWDITKHIKLKTSRDNSHQEAQVIITDETGEKNYEKYDCYLSIIQLDETNAHRTEGGIPTRKGRPKRTTEKEEGQDSTTPSASPVRKPPMVTIPVMPRLQALPRLTRAPGRSSSSRPGPMPFGPILPGAQMMVQLAGSGASGGTGSRPPPPLSLRGAPKSSATTPTVSVNGKTTTSEDSSAGTPVIRGQYQIITPQGAVNTSLETLQLLASGSTNLSKLKKQQKGSLVDSEEKDSQATLSHQMRLLAWLNFLAGDAEEQVSVSSTGEDGREVAKMVLDHEGNPEWKCNSCDFRDSERETVVQHVRLAHARNGPVSLLHAVHRCDVCGYAAGTKRAVQLHIDSSHGGQGGITSRCEGQNPDSKESTADGENMEYNESARTFQCRLCPFTCKKRNEMKPHLVYHTARSDCIFKCMFCPYYVPTKGELFEHLSIHGMEVPASVMEAASKSSSSSSSPGASNQDEGGPKQFVCGACPFESRSRAKLMHHRQFHKPKGLPFHCPHCTYNVTRRHLLSQHIRVHGIDGNIDGPGANDVNQIDERSNSPSPSLTITPVGNATSGENGGDSALTDTSLLPKLTDETTMLLDDIPLVWVSRDNRFFKMFKCRHCPHVNLRKTNIQEHEKMHKTDVVRETSALRCPNCSYVSVNAGVMSAHLKVHGGSMGQCHAVVDPSLSDEDQLRQLTSKATTPCSNVPQCVPAVDTIPYRKADEKVLYYCQQCPARFFFEKEIQIHSRFHSAGLPHTCDHCNYGARQPAHLLAHLKVHTPEYQHRTRTMMSQHRTASTHPPVPGLTLPLDVTVDKSEDNHTDKRAEKTGHRPFSASPPPTSNVMPQPPPTSKYMCDQCPASFSKLLTLQYHQSLHGAKNPHQCHRCSYAGKTFESLQQHLQLHSQYDVSCQAERSAKETDTNKKVESQRTIESSSKSKGYSKSSEKDVCSYHPPIKLKLIGLRPGVSDNGSDGGCPQFKYYVEEQVPLSGVDLLRRKTQLEKEGHDKPITDVGSNGKTYALSKNKTSKEKEELEDDDPKRIGDPKLHYPLHIDKVTGKSREKRYKCNKCPSAFEKTEQYHVHSNLHGSNHKYKCRICDYSVKFYANFMMHINRHKYHERMVSQSDGSPLPVDNDLKYEPVISYGDTSQGDKGARNRMEDLANKENLEDADLTTSERQHLLLQNKKGCAESSKKDDEKERRVYYCQYCPYANIRRDAVDSHSLRHHANGGYGVYRCTFCDYTASQPNFIREHTKVHFRPFKYVHPEGYMRHDRQEILSTPIIIPGEKVIDGTSNDDGSQPTQERHLIFSHEMGVYKPLHTSNKEEDDTVDSQLVSGIEVNFRSGDIVDAPNNFVISLRPAKSKGGQFQMEVNEAFETPDHLANPPMESTAQSCDNKVIESGDSQSFQGSASMHVDTEKSESMEVGETGDVKETSTHYPESSSHSENDKMKAESITDTEKIESGVPSIANGHVVNENQDVSALEEGMVESGEGVMEIVESKMEVCTGESTTVESVQAVTKEWDTDQPEKFISAQAVTKEWETDQPEKLIDTQ